MVFIIKMSNRQIKFPMMFDQHRHAYIKVGENKPETQPMNNTAHTPITNDMEDDIYSAEKDCMAGMTEEQKMEIKKEIRDQSRRTYSIGSAIIGGSFGLVLACMWYFK
ncbi:hypothetical protein QVD99_003097 [Batrachochytrium dendrobatidis]|uniref:Uncharacterized protein n=1 Tax=Batrachochytrium dendrobatidis (strain JEL423) TaxID=403673 RepID=A0A177WWN4_BATDL|nr:hypothetical protein QVD99_003097 [Batrachochytrium dendrobatidis]OAJ44034.1 hypothetical protein, variant [Batrachochytrium dendrobatidis JEL423]